MSSTSDILGSGTCSSGSTSPSGKGSGGLRPRLWLGLLRSRLGKPELLRLYPAEAKSGPGKLPESNP
eukprot:7668410-Pyramimonas_sp.AAC.1